MKIGQDCLVELASAGLEDGVGCGLVDFLFELVVHLLDFLGDKLREDELDVLESV